MTKPGEKNISVFINPKISEDFKRNCDSLKFKQYAAIEGAIRLWLTLSPSEQLNWIQGKPPTPVFSSDPVENEIFVDLDNLARAVAAVTEKIQAAEASKPAKRNRKLRRVKD